MMSLTGKGRALKYSHLCAFRAGSREDALEVFCVSLAGSPVEGGGLVPGPPLPTGQSGSISFYFSKIEPRHTDCLWWWCVTRLVWSHYRGLGRVSES